MLPGDPPFTGSTAQAVVARVLTETPRPIVPQRHTIPPHVEAAVLQALEKLPADRFASAAEFGAALGNHAFGVRPTTTGTAAQRRARAFAWLPWALLLAALGFIAFDGLWPHPVPMRAPVYRFDVVLPENAAWVGD